MNIAYAQLITFVFTVIGGVLIFTFSQALLKLVIEPVQHLKVAIGQTSNTLLFHQAKIGNAVVDDEVSASLKAHAAELLSKAAIVSGYTRAQRVFRLPTLQDIQEASQHLNLMAHGMMSVARQAETGYESPTCQQRALADNAASLFKVGKLLKVKTTYT